MAIRQESLDVVTSCRPREGPAGPISLPIASLRSTTRFRARLNSDHARALAEVGGELPAILISDVDFVVIDGIHRVHAAKLAGRTEIRCCLFDGTDAEAFVEFVRRNVSQGLSLSLLERRDAALHILTTNPEWSDRRIGEACALSAGVVGRIRADSPSFETDRRLGRDGRLRPRDSLAVRGQIVDALQADPDASLRAIARRTHTSPETVRRVKLALPRADPGKDPSLSAVERTYFPPMRALGAALTASSDLAVISTTEGASFAEWFDRASIDDSWRDHVMDVPLGKVYEMADEARRRASAWLDFARRLEARAIPSGTSRAHLMAAASPACFPER